MKRYIFPAILALAVPASAYADFIANLTTKSGDMLALTDVPCENNEPGHQALIASRNVLRKGCYMVNPDGRIGIRWSYQPGGFESYDQSEFFKTGYFKGWPTIDRTVHGPLSPNGNR